MQGEPKYHAFLASELGTTEHNRQNPLLVRVEVVLLKGRCPRPPTGGRHIEQRQMLPTRRPGAALNAVVSTSSGGVLPGFRSLLGRGAPCIPTIASFPVPVP
jgi:hypothetical protein